MIHERGEPNRPFDSARKPAVWKGQDAGLARFDAGGNHLLVEHQVMFSA